MLLERKVHKMKKEIQKAIDKAWENPSHKEKLFQEMYFPLGKPTVEEFIKRMAQITKNNS